MGMKIIILVLALLIVVSGISYAQIVFVEKRKISRVGGQSNSADNRRNSLDPLNNNYGKNYQEGYKEGYTYNRGGIKPIAPIPTIPPIPNIGESSQDAYTRGILEGGRAREE